MIDWASDSIEICFNSRLSKESAFEDMLDQIPKLKSHFIIATSGSSTQKWVALSKHAMLVSAQAVNENIAAKSSDIWIKVLPNHHVGGLSIYARAYLSGAKVVEISSKWNPYEYKAVIENERGTLSSLVPTQVYDIVKKGLTSPRTLRAVFIGGGVLTIHLYEKARQLGWPLLPSYGLTECSSQVATASFGAPNLQLLSHIHAKTDDEDCLIIKSEALLSGFITIINGKVEWSDPKKDGWLKTEDLVQLFGKEMIILGRKDRMVKITGELVNLKNLETILEKICFELNVGLEAALFPMMDERLGYSICLVIAEAYQDYGEKIRQEFLKSVLPFEQIRSIRCVKEIPRTELGKISLSKLASELQNLN